MYSSWKCIAGGQFGTVYQAEVPFGAPGLVAVKQISKHSTIEDRCKFADVFSEIACLDTIRFEDHVCQLYDYGVDETSYWIVMKHYPSTLKKWREALPGSVDDNLPVLLCVYKQVMRAVHVLHRHAVVHYDLKCDNIMIDPDRALDGDPNGICIGEASGQVSDVSAAGMIPGRREDGQIPFIAVADFGESRMMSCEDDLCVRGRGTLFVQCPEMLAAHVAGRKDAEVYDRRKRTGTNQAADVWSLGCLLFELLSGRFLFEGDDESTFYVRVTTTRAGDVVTEANCRLLEGNVPLIDFIRYMLQRNAEARPSVSAAIKKFDSAAQEALRFTSRHSEADLALPRRDSSTPLDTPRSVARSTGASSGGGRRVDLPRPDRPLICAAFGETDSYFTKVLRDVCVLEVSDEDCALLATGASENQVTAGPADDTSFRSSSCIVGTLKPLLSQYLWTHVVDFRVVGAPHLPCEPEVHHVLKLPWSSPSRTPEDFLDFLPTIFDFLRHAAITQGVVLLVDGPSAEDKQGGDLGAGGSPSKAHSPMGDGVALTTSVSSAGRNGLAMAAVLALVVETYQMAVFPALSHLSSQLLITAVRPDVVCALASWQESQRAAAWHYREGSVRVACLCGSVSWHIPLHVLAKQEEQRTEQQRAKKLLPFDEDRVTNCESYLRWLRARFGVSTPSMRYLWLPQSAVYDYSDDASRGVLTRGIEAKAEPVAESRHNQESGGVRIQRFRCRSCQVLTHAEVSGGAAGNRVALVTSYETLRYNLRQAASCSDISDVDASSNDQRHRPPSCFQDTRLEEVMLPHTSLKQCEGLRYI
jgi:serine/threonine protein kinase